MFFTGALWFGLKENSQKSYFCPSRGLFSTDWPRHYGAGFAQFVVCARAVCVLFLCLPLRIISFDYNIFGTLSFVLMFVITTEM